MTAWQLNFSWINIIKFLVYQLLQVVNLRIGEDFLNKEIFEMNNKALQDGVLFIAREDLKVKNF